MARLLQLPYERCNVRRRSVWRSVIVHDLSELEAIHVCRRNLSLTKICILQQNKGVTGSTELGKADEAAF
jgi:hypothetical protein